MSTPQVQTQSPDQAEAADTPQELTISLCREGVRSVALECLTLTFDGLVDLLSHPEVGNKDGSYFVRGPCDASSKRADENITEAHVLVLDADKRIDLSTGEVISGAPDPSLVHDALVGLNLRHHIYTSHSHGADGKGNRYRVVIPAFLGSDRHALLATVDYVVGKLQEARVPLAIAEENYRWSQPWYLPRIRSADAEFVCFTHSEGEPLDVDKIVSDWRQQAPLAPDVDVTGTNESTPPNTAIERFLAERGSPQAMCAYLESKGYVLMSSGLFNGVPCYRFLGPRSESGSPGVVLFNAKSGKWRVVSFHGESDPLSQRDGESGKPLTHDAFDLFRVLEHGGSLRDALIAADPRPKIRVYGGSLNETTRAAIGALAALDPPTVFQRGSMLVTPTHFPDLTEINGVCFPKGSATLLTLDVHALRLHLGSAARFSKSKGAKNKDEWHQIDPPVEVAQSVLASATEWDGLPVLVGVAEAPILRPDGTVHDQPGYDPVTRMYYEGRAPALIGCAQPDLGDAKRAATELLRPFEEFPFSDPEQDRAVVLAYLLTLALRSTLPRAPLFAVSATTPGAGKGLLVEACNLIVRGRDAAIMAPPGGRDADDETRKRITAVLLQGGASVLVDNWTSTIGGNSLNTLFTSDEWTDRVLGQSQMVKLPARVTWAATGNNLVVRGDMVRRTLMTEINPGVERPELRQFANANLAQHVLEHRRELLSALYTILRAYHLAGKPEDGGPVLGRFEDWSRAVCAPVRWLGFPDPIQSQERLREEDPETQNLSALLSGWHAAIGDGFLTTGAMIAAGEKAQWGTGAFESSSSEAFRQLHQVLLEVAPEGGSSISRKRLGWYLKKHVGRVCDGHKLEKDPTSRTENRYRVVKCGV